MILWSKDWVMVAKAVILGLAAALALGGAAMASEPGACPTPAPAGEAVRGPILDIPDAASVCVARSDDPASWVRVTLAEPAASRSTLMAAAFAKNARCSVDADGRGACTVEGRALAGLVNRASVIKAAADWK